MILKLRDKKTGSIEVFYNVTSLSNPYTEESGKVGYLEIEQKNSLTTTIFNIKDFDINIKD